MPAGPGNRPAQLGAAASSATGRSRRDAQAHEGADMADPCGRRDSPRQPVWQSKAVAEARGPLPPAATQRSRPNLLPAAHQRASAWNSRTKPARANSPGDETPRLRRSGAAARRHPLPRPGDTVNVHVKVIEGNKQRIQVFRGCGVEAVRRRNPGDLHRARARVTASASSGPFRCIRRTSTNISTWSPVGDARRAKLWLSAQLRHRT